MVELVVADVRISTEWYANLLRRSPTLADEVGKFVFFGFDCGRLALKQGEAKVGTTSIVFESADLDVELTRLAALGIVPESSVKVSSEGYRRVFVRDPDGNRVGLFEWHSTSESPPVATGRH